jgi:pimeloyl-ACP methyl ester carboxylesterase
MWVFRCLLLFLISMPLSHASLSARVASWGSLEPGPEAIGFKAIFVHDKARVWRQTRPYGAAFVPDLDGRPLQINLWYPAVAGTGQAMRYADYANQEVPHEFPTLAELARRRSGETIGAIPKPRVEALLADPVAARGLAAASQSRFPLVLLLGGLGSEINANFVLAEYLTSHGYVVASISLLGPDERQPEQSGSPESIEANVRDLEFAVPVICAAMNADCSKLAVAGHSIGAVIAALFANRNGNVSAVVGLDGTYGFKGGGDVLTKAIGYAPRKMRAAMLDVRRAEGSQSADIDLSPILAFAHSDLALATVPNVHHSDFTTFALIADRFGLPVEPKYEGTGWNRATGRLGYEKAARIIVEFLNAQFSASPANRSLAAPGVNFRFVKAAPPIPGPGEAIQIAAQGGLAALKSAIQDACRASPPAACVDQPLFNSSGYALMSRDPSGSLTLFEIVAWAHPESANAQDSLADGYLAANRPSDARRASIRAMELAPNDPALDESHREEIINAARQRIAALNVAAKSR